MIWLFLFLLGLSALPPPPICDICLSCSVLASANIAFPPTYPFRVKCLLSMLWEGSIF